MSINLYWHDDNKKIIRIDIIGDWTWKDYHATNITLVDWFESVSHGVYILADFRNASSLTNDAYGAQYVKRARDTRPPNYIFTVNIGASAIEKAIFTAGIKLSTTHNAVFYFTETLEKALQIIETHIKETS